MTDFATPPIARKDHKETNLHGVVLTDDYAWLRDKENPQTIKYLEAENVCVARRTTVLYLYNNIHHERRKKINRNNGEMIAKGIS